MNQHTACMHLLKTLGFTKCLPTKRDLVKVKLNNGAEINGITASPGLVHLSVYCTDGVKNALIKSVRSVEGITKITYPELPIGVNRRPKHDSLGWVRANLKAILWEVNHTSYKLLDAGLVVAIEVDHDDHVFELTMSGAWGTLPMWFRHRFLSALWGKLKIMVDLYGADQQYTKITMYSYDNNVKVIGLRSHCVCMVDDGIVELSRTVREDYAP